MTDSSMNFGPAWIRNLRSEGTTGSGGSGGGASGTNTGTTRYQLAEHRYGREEMLAIFDRSLKPPPSLTAFKALYSEQILTPLALLSTAEEERSWQARPSTLTPACRGRGVSLEHRGGGGRPTRGRGGNYPTYGRTISSSAAAYDSGWGNGEQPEWSSPRKEYNTRSNSTDNWRRVRNNNNTNNNNNNNNDDDDGWRSITSNRPLHDKWGRSTSWRGGEGDADERNGPPPPERGGGRVQQHWHENRSSSTSSSSLRRSWDIDDHLPEWIHENPTEGGGTFDERGAFHGSDDEHFCGGDHQQQQQQQQKRKELQKSASQQQISNNSRNHPPSLTTSKSAIALSKINDNNKQSENLNERDKEPSKIKEESDPQSEKARINDDDEGGNRSSKIEEDTKSAISDRNRDNRNSICTNNGPPSDSSSRNIDKVEEEFARMQEDLVLKLVVDEETPKTTLQSTSSPTVTGVPTTTTSTTTTYDVTTNPIVQPPPNLVVPPPPLPPPPQQEKWYYQDPQGTRQGPFLNVEMAEWYKAGYFSNQLRVMRECDERYFLLGELINLCGGDNPFLSNVRFPILKNDTQHQQQQQQQTKLNDDMLSYQLLSQLAFKQQISMRNLAEPWSALTLQQQELAAQRLLLHQQQQQQQLPHELQFIQQTTPPPPPANPLMFMINQMQQSNKLPGTVLVDKSNSGSSVPNQLVVDPLLVQMGGGIHSLQNRIPTPNLHNHLPGGLPTTDSLTGGGGGGLPGLPTAGGLPNHRPTTTTSHSPIDQENDPITNFLKQFHQQQQKQQRTQIPPIDGSLWHNQPNQFNVPQSTTTPTTTQWAQQPDVPLSMWDLQPPDNHQSIPIDKTTTDPKQNHEIDNEQHQQHKLKEETTTTTTQKDLKKKKELDEKQAKREAEEKRKQEQRKQEADRRAIEEKKKKEEERIRKELERAKREAEEKRMRELEEKRRLKEQRKADEEAKKKSDELRKQEDDKLKKEAREREERKQAEIRLTQQQQHQVIKATTSTTKTAPWCQSNSTQGISLTDIQKAEKERRAQEAALLLKQQQLQEQQQQQQQQQQAEKQPGGLLQLNWAKKPMEPRSVKSFAEIQAEEQEKLAKMTAEARLAAQQREKEAPTTSNTNSIWNGQSLSWANATSTSQWSSNNAGAGFWDDVFVKSSTNKPSTIAVPKSSSTSAMTSVATATAAAATTTATVKQQQQQQQKQTKPKPKKEESQKSVNSSNNNNNNNNNNSANDEFTNWCYKTLSTISTNVDIPTFVSFLRDIESAYDVKDYCKEYLGDGAAIQQFAANFLEKRRSFKPKTNAHKDDMCSPAPAITPSTTTQQHNSTEFQEVKGKNKKNKKSKMLKVDARILGFQVTSAPDRINVGDRDYGDNS